LKRLACGVFTQALRDCSFLSSSQIDRKVQKEALHFLTSGGAFCKLLIIKKEKKGNTPPRFLDGQHAAHCKRNLEVQFKVWKVGSNRLLQLIPP